MWENTALATECPHIFCAGIGPLQLGVVLVLTIFLDFIFQSVVHLAINPTHQVRSSWWSDIFQCQRAPIPTEYIKAWYFIFDIFILTDFGFWHNPCFSTNFQLFEKNSPLDNNKMLAKYLSAYFTPKLGKKIELRKDPKHSLRSYSQFTAL